MLSYCFLSQMINWLMEFGLKHFHSKYYQNESQINSSHYCLEILICPRKNMCKLHHQSLKSKLRNWSQQTENFKMIQKHSVLMILNLKINSGKKTIILVRWLRRHTRPIWSIMSCSHSCFICCHRMKEESFLWMRSPVISDTPFQRNQEKAWKLKLYCWNGVTRTLEGNMGLKR